MVRSVSHLPRFQQIHAAGGGLVGHLDMDAGVFLMKAVQIGHQEIAADGVAGADAELAAAQGAGLHHLRLASLNQVDGGFHIAQQDFSLGC